MSDAVATALGATAGVLGVAVGRIEEVLPALGRVIADVEQDWRDAAGRIWVDRAVELRRTLDRELDAVLAAGRVVASVLERLAEEAVPGPDGDPAPRRDGSAVGGDGAPRSGGAVPGAGISSGASTGTRGGPRLGGTGAQRVDEERGMRIAELGEP